MVVVAIIAVLALVVVPSFMRESRKTKSQTEVQPMFTELANREQQYKQENGSYLAAAACPTTPSKSLQDISSCTAASTPWNTLRVVPHEMKLRCRYTVTIGAAGSTPAAPAFVSPVPTSQAESWFFLLAECDANGNGTYAQFFQSSWDARIQSSNEAE